MTEEQLKQGEVLRDNLKILREMRTAINFVHEENEQRYIRIEVKHQGQFKNIGANLSKRTKESIQKLIQTDIDNQIRDNEREFKKL